MEELLMNERKLREDLATLINNCNLPAVMIKPIIKELFEQLVQLEEQQYQKALEEQNKNREEEQNGQN